MAVVSASSLVEQVRWWADMEHTNFVSDDMILRLLNLGRKELDGLLLRHSLVYAQTNQTIAANGSTAYALPADYFATVNVVRHDPDGATPLEYMDRNKHIVGSYATGQATGFAIRDGYVALYPVPGDGTYTHVYVPEPADLTLVGGTVNYPMGWEQYMVFYAAQACMAKEATVNPILSAEMERLRERIKDEGAVRSLKQGHAIGRPDQGRFGRIRREWER